jgi:hypothetical protein
VKIDQLPLQVARLRQSSWLARFKWQQIMK